MQNEGILAMVVRGRENEYNVTVSQHHVWTFPRLKLR